jgi:hypothetical protein
MYESIISQNKLSPLQASIKHTRHDKNKNKKVKVAEGMKAYSVRLVFVIVHWKV